MGKRIWQMLAIVHVVDIDLLIAAADVVDFQRAPGAVPLRIVFKSKAGIGREGEQEESSEGGENGELHCDIFDDFVKFEMCFLVRVWRNLRLWATAILGSVLLRRTDCAYTPSLAEKNSLCFALS